ncbi:hypothetical protein LXL04_038681 [Taraxacum kok-saghyz]
MSRDSRATRADILIVSSSASGDRCVVDELAEKSTRHGTAKTKARLRVWFGELGERVSEGDGEATPPGLKTTLFRIEIWVALDGKMELRKAVEMTSAPEKVRVVTFNKFGKSVGDEGNELVQYLGTLVRMSKHVPIEYSDRRKAPKQKKNDMYSLIRRYISIIKLDKKYMFLCSKFIIHLNETSEIKKWIFHSMGKNGEHGKTHEYDPSLAIDEIVAQQTKRDNRVNPTQISGNDGFMHCYQRRSTVRGTRYDTARDSRDLVYRVRGGRLISVRTGTDRNDVLYGPNMETDFNNKHNTRRNMQIKRNNKPELKTDDTK